MAPGPPPPAWAPRHRRAGSNGDSGGTAPAPPTSSPTSPSSATNLLSLAELQARLAAIELKQNLRAVKVGGAVIVTGAVLALAALPIALAGIAELLVSLLGMNRGVALIVVAVATFAIAGTCIAIAVARLRGSDLGFPLTREEFTRNLNWIRTVLLYSGRSARRWR